MDEEAVLRKNVSGWRRLNELSDKADRGFKRMSGAEIVEFVRLYRKASADLALMSTQTSNTEVISYLNGLVSRAYGQLYRSPAKPWRETLVKAVALGAQTLRRRFPTFLFSCLIFIGGIVFAFSVMKSRPELRQFFVPEAMEENFTAWKSGKHDAREGEESIGMTALYASNNPRAGIMSTAVSVASFGTITTYILWSNGALLGALAADMDSVGKLGFLASSVAPHGVSEIGGLLVTSTGGFVMAMALINPGRRTRGHALRLAGKDALVLLLTGLVMICLAAPIEGFFSFNPAVPQPLKVAFAVIALTGWSAYFAGFAKEQAGTQGAAL